MNNNFTFIKEDGLFNKELTKNLLEKFDYIFSENKYKNIEGNIYQLVKNDVLKEPLFLFLLNQVKKKIELITGFNDLSFEKLWLVSSSSNEINKNELPYVPHIDKRRYIKAMVYLHDISLDHGPIHLGIIKNTFNLEKKRKKLPNDYRKKKLNIIDKKHINDDLIPMIGNAGDVIFFDTNTPHQAGMVKNGKTRKVLRFDFERPLFNPKQSLFSYLRNRFI